MITRAVWKPRNIIIANVWLTFLQKYIKETENEMAAANLYKFSFITELTKKTPSQEILCQN